MLSEIALMGIEPTSSGLISMYSHSAVGYDFVLMNNAFGRSKSCNKITDEVVEPELLMLCQLSYSVTCLRIER